MKNIIFFCLVASMVFFGCQNPNAVSSQTDNTMNDLNQAPVLNLQIQGDSSSSGQSSRSLISVSDYKITNASIKISHTGVPDYVISWKIGDPLSYSYQTGGPGLYVLSVTETDESGSSDTNSANLILQAGHNYNVPILLGEKIQISDFSGPIAEYLFSGNLNDTSNNGNTGIMYNFGNPVSASPTFTTDHKGVANSAYHSTGNGNYVDCPNSPILQSLSSQVSISFWMKPESQNGRILGRHSNSINAMNGWDLYLSSGKVIFEVSGNNTNEIVTSTNSATIGNYHYIAATYDKTAGTLNLYVDGILSSTSGFTTGVLNYVDPNPEYHSEDFSIGAYWASGVVSFSGDLDDIKLYSRVLSSSEIATLGSQ